MIGNYQEIPARYRDYPGRRYAEHPFVEALPLIDVDKDAIQRRLKNIPTPPTAADRKLPEMVRFDEVNTIGDIVYARPAYKRLAPSLLSNLKEGYFARNPLTIEDKRRRHLIALSENLGDLQLPANWKSSARGSALFGQSGSGKTTFVETLSLPLQVVIVHTSYRGQPLQCRQVPWLKLRIPHDGTVRSLCIQFFTAVDSMLGDTNYEREARRVGRIAEMVLLIAKVATAISLGMIVIDELQNLKAARGPQVEHLLNLFSQLIELAGIPLLVIGTPAVQSLMESNVRNIRKLTSGAETRLEAMAFGSPELAHFQDEIWEFQWTRHKASLTQPIREAWNRAGGGNPAFTVMSFMFAQRIEIGGREVIDETTFARVSKSYMASLQPAIRALCSGSEAAMNEFDDLIFTKQFDALRMAIRWDAGAAPSSPGGPVSEFDELATAEEQIAQRAARGKRSGDARRTSRVTQNERVNFKASPVEDPLLLR
jgi:hypothetical protein